MFQYRNILKQAVLISWRHKYLWFFGLFATLLGGGGEYEIISKGLSGDTAQTIFPNFSRLAETGIFRWETFSNFGAIFKANPGSAIILLVMTAIIIILSIFLIWLMIVSQTALVNNSSEIINRGKNSLGIKDGVVSGIKNFWPVFGLNIMMKIIISLAFALISLPIILSKAPAINYLYILLFIILIPAAIIFAFIIKYAVAYVVIKNDNFINSMKNGWKLFTQNWLVSVEMAFILFFINFLAGLIIILSILILVVPFLFLAIILYKLASVIGFWLIIMIGMAVLLCIVVLGGAALTTFQTVSWTGLFLELINRGGTSKIIRIAENWKK
jgi:hypothetical protein